jgi:hypothetical protein
MGTTRHNAMIVPDFSFETTYLQCRQEGGRCYRLFMSGWFDLE